ncbi:PadR family transcriptional regulator [Lacisediminihabitans profunda]|uniref:PadR family transcriptional regulator n=1 Tax=Lacisediminihabitans profunda TaxID=2594790 RepID=A0A5C8UIH6_9MICO|nr:PadR family transcriptional regulator [Lacisediminihabitans profunda]TXN27757.1 PadR family transcriptional regulator [Lacisediminihabitans profunda]
MSLRNAVLGFLALTPSTGYDLKSHFDGSVRQFWTADQAQIYRVLGQLVQDGLVTVEVIPQPDRPDRKVHHITAAGLAELDGWLASPLDAHTVREPFLLRLFFAGRLGAAGVIGLIDARAAAAEGQLAALTAVRAQQPNPADLERALRLATLDNGIRHTQTELDWLRDLRGTVTTTNTTSKEQER